MQTKFVSKMSNHNLKSGLNCPVYIFGPVDTMVIDKTDSLAANQIMFIFMNSAKHFWQISLEKY